MRSYRTALIAVLLGAPLAACRSPFGVDPQAETGPDAGKVGRGIHGWPLLEHAPHGSGWRTDVVWPLYSGIATEGGGLNSTAVLLPIFLFENEGDRTRTGILRPLYDLETRGDDVFDLDVAWPIFKWVDEPHRTERRVFPFYWSTEGEDSGETHYWPLWGREWSGTQEKQWVLTPFFSHDADPERDLSLWDVPWPLVHFGHDGDTEYARVLPFLWHEASRDEHTTIVFPFIWDIADPTSSFRMVFPFYARGDESDGDHVRSVLPPLYIRGHRGEADYTWLGAGIVGWETSPERWSTHVFPVLWLRRDDDGDGSTHVWPLFGWEHDGDRRVASTVWPFFRYEWTDDRWKLDLPWPLVAVERSARHAETRAWPLFSHESWTDEGDEARTEGDVLLFVSTWDSRGEDESDFRILWKLVESTTHAGKDTFVINPLFRHESNDAGDTYWSFLFGLVARKQEAGEVDWRFLWVL